MLFLILIFVLSPSALFAYLDPGSGAILINLIIAGFAAALYSLKGLFWRILGRKEHRESGVKQRALIGVLSEGRQYWSTFRPLIEALIEHQVYFSYHTLDIEDPALQMDSEYMDARFLGYGFFGYQRASSLKNKILVSTTPNIGCKGFPIRKSPHIKNLIHIFHSINDLSMYRKHSLDFYDSVFMVGEWQKRSIRELEEKRGLPQKELISLGLPYMDSFIAELNKQEPSNLEPKNCILIASSWRAKGLLFKYGTDFIEKLAKEGYRIILRPHPQSFISEKSEMEAIKERLSKYANIVWDTAISPMSAMQKADILISDTSSIRFDYAFLFSRPVITFPISAKEMPGFERDDIDELWMDTAAEKIGHILKDGELDKLGSLIDNLLNSYDGEAAIRYRNEILVNFAKASDAIALELKKITGADNE